jgi:hypothetical protein
MSDKTVVDGLVVQPGRSVTTLEMNFTKPVTFGFLVLSMGGRSAYEVGQSELGPGRCSLHLQTVHSVNASFAQFLSEAHLGVADGLPEGPGRSTHR